MSFRASFATKVVAEILRGLHPDQLETFGSGQEAAANPSAEREREVLATMDGWMLVFITFFFTAVIHLIDLKYDFLSKYEPLPLLAVLEPDTDEEVPVQNQAYILLHLRRRG